GTGRLYEQRRVQLLDAVELVDVAEHRGEPEILRPDRYAVVRVRDLAQQHGLGVGVRVLDADAPADRLFTRVVFAGVEQRAVDSVAGHELLRLGGERVGFGLECR